LEEETQKKRLVGFQPGNKLQTIGNERRAGPLRHIKALLEDAVSEEDIALMLQVQVQKAMTGNTDACRLVLSYRLGTPDQVQDYVKRGAPKVLNIAYVNASPTGAPMPEDVDREEGGGGTHPAPNTHLPPTTSSGASTPGDPSQIVEGVFSDSQGDGTISEIPGSLPQQSESVIQTEQSPTGVMQTFDSAGELITDLDSVAPSGVE
jgi:hypothetical protein